MAILQRGSRFNDGKLIASQEYVDNHSNKKDNPHNVTKAQVGLGSVQNYAIATKAEAEAGAINNKYMTPIRAKEAIAELETIGVSLVLNNQVIEYNLLGTNPSPTTTQLQANVYGNSEADTDLFFQFFARLGTATAWTSMGGASASKTANISIPANISQLPLRYKVEVRRGSASGAIIATDYTELIGKTAQAIVGSNVNISGNTISAVNTTYSNATTSASGLMSSTDKSKLDGIATGANNYTHPSSHPASMITESSTKRFVTDTEKSTWNSKQNALTAGSNVSISGSTISATNTTYSVATASSNGLMASGDKSKLDGIAAGANNYTHPSSHPASIITQNSTNRFVTDTEKSTWNAKQNALTAGSNVTISGNTISAVNTTYGVATTSSNGLMAAADKVKLNGIAAGATTDATANTHISKRDNPHSVTKSQVGLSNVSNALQATKSEFDSHVSDNIHITNSERSNWNNKLDNGTAVMNYNAFASTRLYISELHNALFLADKRYNVTAKIFNSNGTVYSSPNAGVLFNGDYEGGIQVPAGRKLVVMIDFNGSWPTYPYGMVYLNSYHTSNPKSASMRTYTDFAAHKGERITQFTSSSVSGGTNSVLSASNGQYQIQFIEITYEAPADSAASLVQIDFHLNRDSMANDKPFLNKYGPENLYFPLNMNRNKITNISTPTVSLDAVNKDYVDNHAGNNTHITTSERNAWNAKQNKLTAGSNISISGNTISATNTTYGVASTSSNGLMSSTDKSKLNGIATGANNYTHPSSHPASMITESSTKRFVTDTEKATWNGKQNSLTAGSNITISGNTISAVNTNTTYSVATTSANGLMSSSDKSKLNGIATGANNDTIKDQRTGSQTKLWTGTLAQYNAIGTKDANTLYVVSD